MTREEAWKQVRDEEKELERLKKKKSKQTDPNFIISYEIKINSLEERLVILRKQARLIPKDS